MKLAETKTTDAFNYSYLLKRVFPYIKPLLFRIFIAFALTVPLGLLDGFTAFVLKPYIDVVVNGNDAIYFGYTVTRDFLAFWVPPGIIIFAAIQGLLKYVNSYLMDWISLTISNSIKVDLFKKLTSMDSKFYDENPSGIIIQRFLGDPDAASRSIIDTLSTIITAATSALGLIFVLLYNSWKLAFVGVVVLVVAFIPMVLLRKKIKQVSNDSAVVGGNITTCYNETYSGNKVMAGYCLKDRLDNKVKAQIKQAFNLSISLTKRVSWLSPIMYLIASFGVAIVMYFGNHLIISNELSTGSLASFITSLLLLYKPVKELGRNLTSMQGIFVALNRVFELFDLVPEINENPNGIELKNAPQTIEFKNVNFEYYKDKPVLKNINFKVKHGEMLALVGNSGGGKSTVVNLIPRFYNLTSGSILFDGVNINDFTLKSLRQSISEVFQDNFLYSGTIKENILMGNPNATEDELNKVIVASCVDEFTNSLEKGLDTMIGERGMTLSGGQRQRVAIARAMIKNSPVIILDEATSALDNKSEAIVQKALENLMKDKTVFIIAHRLSTIKNADKIIVINEGYLVEEGTHEELLGVKDGKYKNLYEMQFKKQPTQV